MNKKGNLGTLQMVGTAVMILLVILTLSIVMILVGAVFEDNGIVKSTFNGMSFVNTTLPTVINSSYSKGVAPTGLENLVDCTLTVTRLTLINATYTLSTANYSVSGCYIKGATAVTNGDNNSYWNLTGTYTYAVNYVSDIHGNSTLGLTTFWNNIPTVFTIMFVVILISFIVLVIYYVKSLSGGTQTLA